jgi:Protein of unknown function (DUF3102)
VSNELELDDLAERIRNSHALVRRSIRSAVEHAMTTGDLLNVARDRTPHGQWAHWLQQNCEISDRTARVYMQLANNREAIERSEDRATLTINGAVRMLTAPKEDDDDTELAKTANEIRKLQAGLKHSLDEVKSKLNAAREVLRGDEAKFMDWLELRFPSPTDPEELALQELLAECIADLARPDHGIDTPAVKVMSRQAANKILKDAGLPKMF